MAKIPYLAGGELPKAALMNKLFTDADGLDDKLNRLLGGRSFFLGQSSQPPARLVGRAFFFTSGTAVYAGRVPGVILSSGVARPYNHSQFTTAVAAITLTGTLTDSVTRVATVNQIASSAYTGLPLTQYNGLFDWSLEAHKLTAIAIDGLPTFTPGTAYQPNEVLSFVGGTGAAAQIRVLTTGNNQVAVANPIIAGPGGYAIGQILTAAGGTLASGGSPCTVQVTAVSGGLQRVTAATIVSHGDYAVLPATPNAFTGGTGSGANFNLQFGGVPITWEMASSGAYSVAPSSPNTLSGGSGSGAVATCTFSSQTFYIAEKRTPLLTSGGGPPEKHYNFALAEIIIEGPTSVDIPVDWNKYSCFRLHNLNHVAATVTIGSETIELEPLECATVRREIPDSNYRVRHNSYFFEFEGGDPRAYWFLPKELPTSLADSNNMTNSHQANNLMNPAIALDWAQHFNRTLTHTGLTNPELINGWYAAWNQDPSEQVDVGEHYTNLFGDPSNTATLFGDLIHHRGDITIVRQSKTLTEPISGKPALTFDSVRFNGYATIVADFAAKQLDVTANGSGDLVVTSTDSANWVQLVPIGTNLFKQGETIPTVVNLRSGGRTIENVVFESDSFPTLTATPPQVVFPPTLVETPNESLEWHDLNTVWTDPDISATDDDLESLDYADRSSSTTVHGIHALTVADILEMDLFGDPAQPGQTGAYTTFASRALKLTPQGLVLTYTEERSTIPPSSGDQYEADWITGAVVGTIPRAIQFRGHGWGYVDATEGSRKSGWFSPRTGRQQMRSDAYSAEVIGVNGADFTVRLNTTETSIKVLTRSKNLGLNSVGGRFWQCREPGDAFASYLYWKSFFNVPLFTAFWDLHFGATGDNILVPAGALLPPVAMTLLPEMYNHLARAVNAITTAVPLGWATLRWAVGASSVGLGRQAGTVGMANTSNGLFPSVGQCGLQGASGYPVPMDLFMGFETGSQYETLCTQLGITVLDSTDFPGGKDEDGADAAFAYFQGKQSQPQIVYFYGNHAGGSSPHSVSIETEFLDAESIVAGTATGSRCVGTYDPTAPLAGQTAGLGVHPIDGSNGSFKMADDGSGRWMILSPLPTEVVPLTAWAADAGGYARSPFNAWGLVNLNDTSGNLFYNFRWCTIDAVKTVVEALDFDFSLMECVRPLSLRFIKNPTTSSPASASGTTTLGLSGLNGYVTMGHAGWGQLLAFVPTESAGEALWKVFEFTSAPVVGYVDQVTSIYGQRWCYGIAGALPTALGRANGGTPSDIIAPVLKMDTPYGLDDPLAYMVPMVNAPTPYFGPQYSPIAFNVYTGGTVVTKVNFVGQGLWTREHGYAGDMLDYFDPLSTSRNNYTPYVWHNAEADYELTLSLGMNILSHDPAVDRNTTVTAKYWALFDAARPSISLA